MIIDCTPLERIARDSEEDFLAEALLPDKGGKIPEVNSQAVEPGSCSFF